MTDNWHGCYDASWKALRALVPAAFAHPAKIAPGLAERIYQHAVAKGWLRPGMSVVDPFGGVGGTGLWPALNGYAWVGCELEPRFVELAEQNFALWARKFGRLPEWVAPRIVQGDSRFLGEVMGEAGLIVSSPPYSEGLGHGGMPTAAGDGGHKVLDAMQLGYGTSPGQLGSLPEGEAPGLVVSSPPFEKQQTGAGLAKPDATYSGDGHTFGTNHGYQNQGDTPGQLGNTDAATFWSAAAAIVAEVYRILAPGGHAIWVCKDFVRARKRVPFSDQWQALCEAAGFRTVCRHRAMLVKKHRKQRTLDGGVEQRTTARKSFFRRMAENRGSPPIDWEDLICQVKD